MQVKIEITPLAHQVFDHLTECGGTLYFVGGAVRDTLLKHPVKDIDVEVYGLSYDQLIEALSSFGSVESYGASFAVVHLTRLSGYEFSLPRRETKIGEKHTDFSISIDPHLPLREACKRRDFTMNAMMVNYETNELYDFYGGLEDLRHNILRAVDDHHFKEDPLRVLRAASFMSRYMFKTEDHTFALCREMVNAGMIETLSRERIYEEYTKLLMGMQPSFGLTFLKDIGALPKYLEDLVYCDQRRDYHPEGSVWNHTLLVVDLCALIKDETSDPISFMWASLLHDIGKPAVTTKEGHAYAHNIAGVKVFKSQVKVVQSKRMRRYIAKLIEHHMDLMNYAIHKTRPITFKRLLKDIEGIYPVEDLAWFTRCDKMGRGYIASSQIEMFNTYMNEMIEKCGDRAEKPIVTGDDLIAEGFENHHEYGVLLKEAYDEQLQGLTKAQILRRLKSER